MTAKVKTARKGKTLAFPSCYPVTVSKRAWYYEGPKSILLVAEFDTQPPGAVQVRIPLRKLEEFCKRAHASKKRKGTK